MPSPPTCTVVIFVYIAASAPTFNYPPSPRHPPPLCFKNTHIEKTHKKCAIFLAFPFERKGKEEASHKTMSQKTQNRTNEEYKCETRAPYKSPKIAKQNQSSPSVSCIAFFLCSLCSLVRVKQPYWYILYLFAVLPYNVF